MLKLVIGMSPNNIESSPRRPMSEKGFTLIEILIVIVIIGTTVGFALLSYGDFGASRRLHFTADQLVNTLKMAQQQALLEGSTLGLSINNKSYQIMKFHPPHTWSAIPGPSIYKAHDFPANTVIKINQAMNTNHPSILINASGEITPFLLQLGTSKQMPLFTIQSQSSGALTVTEVPQ